MDTLLPSQRDDVLELDELWSFVGSKTQTLCCGWPFVDAPARSSPGRWATAACKARVTCERPCPGTTGVVPPAATIREAYAAAFPERTHRCCGKEAGETNHVERWFGTLRARVSRLVRKAYSFSKHAENHLDAIPSSSPPDILRR